MPEEENETIECENCQCEIDDGSEQEQDGDAYCEDCYSELFTYCEHCDSTISANDIVFVGDDYMCEDCRDNNYTCCDYCSDYISNNETINTNDSVLCDDCYCEHYFTCNCCGEVYNNDYYAEDGYCQNCYIEEEENGLYNYSYKPDTKFYGDGDLFFGIELEIESEGNSIYDAVQSLPNFVYAKADSSMNDGMEVVSHPTSWQWLQENKDKWDKILDLRDSGFLSYKTDTCGMHVHMSKKAFSTLHLYKFLKMFFENQSFITTISRRKSSNLAQWASLQSDESIVYKARKKGCENRFTAVNLQNSDSVEVRIFRGTLSPVEFWRNIEFCKAVYEFTKDASIKDITTDEFCKYAVEHKKEYPNLEQFLVDKNLCQTLFEIER